MNRTVPQQPSNFMTVAPFVLGVVGALLAAVGNNSQQLADAGLAIPAGITGLCAILSAPLLGYRNQKQAAAAPTEPPPLDTDGKPISELDHVLSQAVQLAFADEQYDLATKLIAARKPAEAVKP